MCRWIGLLLTAAVLGTATLLLSRCMRTESALRPDERLLFSFERPTMLPMVGGTARRELSTQHATHGHRSLRLSLSRGHETVILDFGAFPMDWRGWRSLKVDVHREGAPVSLNFRLSDSHGRRHWQWSLYVQPGANTLTIDLSAFKDAIDLSSVAELMWYAEQPSGTIWMDYIRLSR